MRREMGGDEGPLRTEVEHDAPNETAPWNEAHEEAHDVQDAADPMGDETIAEATDWHDGANEDEPQDSDELTCTDAGDRSRESITV